MLNNLVYGRHSAKEALQTKKVQKVYFQEDIKGRIIDDLIKLAKVSKVPVTRVPKSKLDKMTEQANHQGIVVTVSDYKYLSFQKLLDKLNETDDAVVLILDHLEDPHNFGSILRTADAINVTGVIIPKDRAVGITPVVTKTATGAVEYLDITRVTNLKQAIQILKDNGFWIFGTDMKGTKMQDWNASGKVALIIGNEGKGMSQGLRKEVDEMITIPMTGHVQSLNASVAAGVLMYEIYRKRQ